MAARRISERDFLGQILALATLCLWRTAHFRPALTRRGWRTAVQGDGVGFPDLVLCRERVIWVEAKVPPNALTEAQAEWLEALRGAGAEVHVWTPSDWGEIERVLGLRRGL